MPRRPDVAAAAAPAPIDRLQWGRSGGEGPPTGAEAEPGPEPQCMPVYQEYEVGPVKVVRRNTCSAEVYLFGEPIIG